jgi:hypothetical protein
MVPGDDVFFVGRFIGHDGRQQNAPTVRFGHLALMPSRIRAPSGRVAESFLVEGRSLPGYSGAPVFVYRMPYGAVFGDSSPGGGMQTITRPVLLGVDWVHLADYRKVLKSDKKTPFKDAEGKELFVEQNSGMMGVVPAWKLIQLLNDPEVTGMRDKVQDALDADTEHVIYDVAEGGDQSEFERFEDLARKLVNTPKSEIDEKRKESDS